MKKRNEYSPQTVTHPGVTLKEKLDELGMSQKEFAVRTGKPEQTIVKVISGSSAITPDMAVQFETVLKVPAKFWLNRQLNYDEAVARARRTDILAEAHSWAGRFPVSEMMKRAWLPKMQAREEWAEALLNFFSFSTHGAWEDYYLSQQLKVSFRISIAHYGEPYAISAWLRQGELEAEKLVAPPFNKKTFTANLVEIKRLMAEHPDDFFPKLQALCLEAGVKVVYTPCLPKAPIHGSTRWLSDDTPLIQLSARYHQNDRFWFTFFHEAGHILLHGKKHISIESAQRVADGDEHERAADEFAIKWTFSEEEEQEVLKLGVITEQDIVDFAGKFGTHPAMIIGRFQHKKLIRYHVGRKFLRPVHLD
ncbi:MAG: HigA family addiction module antidote protein [Deltaproteobacteria bacterium]|nr:HigA family addiction module antidote protein [Deltaproteobacteria bacterium]